MRRIPLSAIIGMILTGAFILSALLADFIAPYGMAEGVGDVWEPISADPWFGPDSIWTRHADPHDLRRPDHDPCRRCRHDDLFRHRIGVRLSGRYDGWLD